MTRRRSDPPLEWTAPTLRRAHPATLRAAWWAWRALRKTRVRLPAEGTTTLVKGPPRLPPGAARGVAAVVRRWEATCLERALVVQRWFGAQGDAHDVVIGVSRRDGKVMAHAWLDWESPSADGVVFEELTRLPTSPGRDADGRGGGPTVPQPPGKPSP